MSSPSDLSGPSSSPGTGASTSTSETQYPNYAFLVHSQSSLTSNLPPKVDNTMLSRQKRRRTSPEDHAILEAAYQTNSKPDKAERIEIVSRVALGEKEVQIWFQNRRQNDRRKSRPLLPHELVPHFRNAVPQELIQSSSLEHQKQYEHSQEPVSFRSETSATVATKSTPMPEETDRAPSRASSIHDLLNPISSFGSNNTISAEDNQLVAKDSQTSGASNAELSKPAEENSPVTNVTHNSTVGAQSISKKRAFDDIDAISQKRILTGRGGSDGMPSLMSQGSNVRLSLSQDGAVKIKTNDEDTPSPPKQRMIAPQPAQWTTGLQRSKSAVGLGESAREGQKSRGRPTSGTFGRSRDARTWEFYCDTDAKDALSAQAETERSGSAVGAINLIRSQSQKSKLKAQNDSRRREALTPKAGSGNARPSQSAKGQKPKLSRAMSSMARLQGVETQKASGKGSKLVHVRSPSGDSDKENWAPGTRSSQNPMRRTQASSQQDRRILADSDQVASHATSLVGALASDRRARALRKSLPADMENLSPGDGSDGEVEAFMSGGNKGEDLDCIQGLLSLSQGAWK